MLDVKAGIDASRAAPGGHGARKASTWGCEVPAPIARRRRAQTPF